MTGMAQNERFLFRPEYRWPPDRKTKPFYTVPAAWRRFVFQVLSTREFAIYHYYLSIMDPDGLAFPAVDQIAVDMAFKDKDAIRRAVKRLVDLGFLLAPDSADRTNHKIGKRPLVQRPCPQYTLKTLLEKNVIDGSLYPVANAVRSDHERASDKLVNAAIKTLLEDSANGSELVAAYRHAQEIDDEEHSERLKRVLEACLDEVLGELRMASTAIAGKGRASKSVSVDNEKIASLPVGIQEAFGVTRVKKKHSTKRSTPQKPKR